MKVSGPVEVHHYEYDDSNIPKRTATATGEEFKDEWSDYDRLLKGTSTVNGVFQENTYDTGGIWHGNGAAATEEPIGHITTASYQYDESGGRSHDSGTGSVESSEGCVGGIQISDDIADSGMFSVGHRNCAGGVLGRFISRDPIGHSGGLNLYAYSTSPLQVADPSGLHDVWVDDPDTGERVRVPHAHPPENTQAWQDGDRVTGRILRKQGYRYVNGRLVRAGEYTTVQFDPSIGLGFTSTSNCYGFAAISTGLTGPNPAPVDPDVRGFHLYFEGLQLLINAGLKSGSVKHVTTPQAGDLVIYDKSGSAFDPATNRLRSNSESCPHAAVLESANPLVDRSKYGNSGPVVLTGGTGAFGGTPIYFRVSR